MVVGDASEDQFETAGTDSAAIEGAPAPDWLLNHWLEFQETRSPSSSHTANLKVSQQPSVTAAGGGSVQS